MSRGKLSRHSKLQITDAVNVSNGSACERVELSAPIDLLLDHPRIEEIRTVPGPTPEKTRRACD
jgi:hypothetical protein